tara:strand:+ start:39600 stop:41729 length:2130 start_codon:yes stop_codon:yes gene_type:complete
MLRSATRRARLAPVLHLVLCCVPFVAFHAAAVGPPGEDLPPAGRSLFDRLIANESSGEASVPFPFGSLMQRISAHLDRSAPSGGLSVVLIPLGRSLQRHAAGDAEAFRYPRVVAAATGEPPVDASPGHPYLKDRLYIAFHEKAAALEVISYNDEAARFEFQLVRNYRAGATAEVGYANRSLCLSCHQNAAPIFSRQSWDETSANPDIAARLAATGQSYYGLQWRHGVDVPDAIDGGVRRANLLATAQRLWQHGCAAASRDDTVRCRAAALKQALRYRLGGELPAVFAAETEHALTRPLLAAWHERWPAGLPVPDPQVPNRLPFAGIAPGERAPDKDELYRYADIGSAFDPLALRAPLETWQGRDARDVRRFVQALSMFFSRTDVLQIERHLSSVEDSPGRSLELNCSERKSTARTRLDLDCRGDRGTLMLARLDLQGGGVSGGSIDRLQLGDGSSIGSVELRAPSRANGSPLRFELTRAGGRVRTQAGDAIRSLHVSLATDSRPARATLDIGSDLVPLDLAIDALAAATIAGTSDALDDAPLRRTAVLAPLFEHLGMQPVMAREHTARAPARSAEAGAQRAGAWPIDLQPFARQCSQCHADATAFPPGFLHGDDTQIRRTLDTCAERMLYRLTMNQTPVGARSKTPMPPPAAVHAPAFAQSADLPAMLGQLDAMLKARGSTSAAVMARTYATLPHCRYSATGTAQGDPS